MKLLVAIISGHVCLAGISRAQEVHASVVSAPGAPGRAYPGWTVFENPRRGYEIPVPPGVRALGNPAAGGEASFASGDGSFRVKVWGGLSPQPGMLAMDDAWKRARKAPGRAVTNGTKGPSWFVLVGTKNGGTRFYEKFVRHGDHVAAMAVTWPGSRAREFIPWVKEVSEGFQLVTDPAYELSEADTQMLSGAGGSRDNELPEAPGPPFSGIPLDAEATASQSSPDAAHTGRRSSTAVDVTPPGDPDNKPEKSQTESNTFDPPEASANGALEETAEPKPPPPAAVPELPVGEPVPGKKGFVYSPFLTEKKLVDAIDIPSRTKVKCPYTGKVFRLP